MPPFRHLQKVRFAEIDRAGIVYYPRFFNYFHVAFEELFGPVGYRDLIEQRKIGFPVVHVECDFERPIAFGDEIAVDIHADRVGGKSVTLRYVLLRPADGPDAPACAVGRVTCACIDMTTFRPIPIPDDLRAMFEALR